MPIPYSVKCSECSRDLDVIERKMDNDGDIMITVEPCRDCIDAAVEDNDNAERL